MAARWDKLPPKARVAKPRRPPAHGSWTCGRCRELLVGTYDAAQRHADTHPGATRLECTLSEPERDTVPT